MEYITLTGISRRVLKDLISNKMRTLELRSPSNFFSMLGVQPGDRIFLTEATADDVVPGTSGLIATVKAIQTMTHRVVQSTDDFYEEREAQASRAQLQLMAVGRVRKITNFEMGTPLKLDVDEVRYCDAR